MVAFIGIFIALIIMYKNGILCKGGAKNNGYSIASDKSRSIMPGEIRKDNQFDAIMIKNRNDNVMK